jgi:putative ABC transport system ATP-binding protein
MVERTKSLRFNFVIAVFTEPCYIFVLEDTPVGILIDICDIYKIYNPGESEVRALDGVSLRVEEGEFLAIIGHSGSGKSTLMNIMGCLDAPTSGEYLLGGEKVGSLSDDRLSIIRNRQIGFIFQNFNLIPSLSALENVELPLLYRGLRHDERRGLAEKALTRVGLSKRMGHRPCELSGGQQQRVAIARAIATRPPVILADEPTGNLDSKSGSDILQMLHEFNDDGRTIILITHDPSIAAAAKRVVRISDGRITEGGVA